MGKSFAYNKTVVPHNGGRGREWFDKEEGGMGLPGPSGFCITSLVSGHSLHMPA